jgi:hypothetical protein
LLGQTDFSYEAFQADVLVLLRQGYSESEAQARASYRDDNDSTGGSWMPDGGPGNSPTDVYQNGGAYVDSLNRNFIDPADARAADALAATGDYSLSRPTGSTFSSLLGIDEQVSSNASRERIVIHPFVEVKDDAPTPIGDYDPAWDGSSGLSSFPKTGSAHVRNTGDDFLTIVGAFVDLHDVLKAGQTFGETVGENYDILNPAGWGGKKISQVLAAKATRASLKKAASWGKLQREIDRGRAPGGVDRVDRADPPMAPEAHIHYTDGTSSTVTGQVHDAGAGNPKPSNAVRDWLQGFGWTPPAK